MRGRAERAATDLLATCGVDRAPVPVEQIARQLGAVVTYEPLEDEVAGILYRDGRRVLIGVNSAHPVTRQRFTIAHEIGHLRLHGGHAVHVDRVLVHFRARLSAPQDREEVEANSFAAALLMPAQMVAHAARQRLQRASAMQAEELIEVLASRFAVSRQAMEYRLKNLGFLIPW